MNKNLYYENLDGLRFFSFLSVFFFHNFALNFIPLNNDDSYNFLRTNIVINGNLGVNFFFVLSGFLITTLIIVEKKLNSNINVPYFWLRRVFRIWPLFYICIFIGFIIYPMLKHLSGQVYPPETATPWAYLTFLNNFDILRKGWPHSATLSVLWSVAVEEQFYLVWPLILFLTPIKRMWIPFVIILTSSLVFRAFNTDEVVRHHHTLSCIGDMTMGAIGAWLIEVSARFKKYVHDMSRPFIILIYGLLVLILIFTTATQVYAVFSIFQRLLIAIVFLFIILEQTFAKNSFYKMSNFKMLSKLGTLTYGLYCFHSFAILIATTLAGKLHFDRHVWQVILIETPLAFILVTAFGFLSYRFIETPFLKLKNRFAFIKHGSHQ